MATKSEVKAFMADHAAETGEKLTMAQARALMEQQAEHDAEATAGSGIVHVNGISTGVEVQPEVQAPPAQVQAEGNTPSVPTLHVKQGLALRGGRGEWYKLLCKYDGKPVAQYLAEGKANPASHYTARSTKCGQPKTPESRLSWFKRAGIVTIS